VTILGVRLPTTSSENYPALVWVFLVASDPGGLRGLRLLNGAFEFFFGSVAPPEQV
jgi:hypothetical protein